MSKIVFVGGKRTPFGGYLESLARVPANDLGSHAAKAAIKDSGIDASEFDACVFGMVGQTDRWNAGLHDGWAARCATRHDSGARV